MTSEKQAQKFHILMTRHYSDLCSASYWLCRVHGNLIQPIRSTTQLDSDASSEVSREFLRSFLRRNLAGKQVVAPPNVGYFLRLQICLFSFCGCLELPGYWTFHESLLSGGMFITLNFQTAEKDVSPAALLVGMHMQDSPGEVCRSWRFEVPVTLSFCLECHRNVYSI